MRLRFRLERWMKDCDEEAQFVNDDEVGEGVEG